VAGQLSLADGLVEGARGATGKLEKIVVLVDWDGGRAALGRALRGAGSRRFLA
jgi:hypothetical protein